MRRILIFSMFFVITSTLIGQSKFQPEWNVGVGFGTTFPTLSLEPAIKTKSLLRYQGGVSIRYMSEKNLGLIGEINYSQQGWEQDFSKSHPNADYFHEHTLDYIEIPILTHIYFGNKVRFFVNLGPKISFLLSEKETMNQSLQDDLASDVYGKSKYQTAQFGKSAETKFDYGLLFGGGLEFRSGIGHFALEGRYTLGLGDIYKSNKKEFTRSANRVMSVKLTYYTKLF